MLSYLLSRRGSNWISPKDFLQALPRHLSGRTLHAIDAPFVVKAPRPAIVVPVCQQNLRVAVHAQCPTAALARAQRPAADFGDGVHAYSAASTEITFLSS